MFIKDSWRYRLKNFSTQIFKIEKKISKRILPDGLLISTVFFFKET